MLSVLIVDDEPRHRKSLCNTIQSLKGYKITEARNGEEALKIIQSKHIDFIITDIQMPYLSGLDLLKEISQRGFQIPTIILSAYSQFEYAQEALRYGVVEYLLKPINIEKLSQILDKVETILLEQNKNMEKFALIEDKLNKTMDIYVNDLLRKLTFGALNEDELQEVNDILPHNKYYIFFSMTFSDSSVEMNKIAENDIAELFINLKYWIRDFLKSIGHSISFVSNESDHKIHTLCTSSEPINLTNAQITTMLNNFIKEINNNYNISVTIGFSEILEDLTKTIKTAYEQSTIAHNLYFYYGYNLAFPYNPKKMATNSVNISKNLDIKGICACITSGNIEKAVELFKMFFDRSISTILPQPQEFKNELINIFVTMCNITLLPHKEKEYSQIVTNVRQTFLKSKTYREIYQLSLNFINDVVNALSNTKANKNDIIVELCKDYINSHYAEAISLESCADALYFNSNYFSVFFKENVGINFSDYLQNFRIGKAKELLCNTSLKVYEVAEQCGFRNVKYFNRVFKKIVNLTPEEYRRTSNI